MKMRVNKFTKAAFEAYSVFLPLIIVALTLASTLGAEHSELWGRNGENWNSRSRLPDFSFAGYHRGEKEVPVVPPGRSVKEFRAKGDGETDDSEAFLDALNRVESGAIEIPEGRYKLSRIFEIRRPGVILRGAGPRKTTLFFEIPLNEIKPNWGPPRRVIELRIILGPAGIS